MADESSQYGNGSIQSGIKRMGIVVTKMCGEEDESDDIFSRLSDPQRDN